MIYRWKRKGRRGGQCYLKAIVPSSATLRASGKSYQAKGDFREIEVWNVTALVHKPTSLSWNTRPIRQNLLGTVNFTNQPALIGRETEKGYDGKELRTPTPRIPCAGVTTITLEISCKSCRLEFDQIATDPALGPFINPSLIYTVLIAVVWQLLILWSFFRGALYITSRSDVTATYKLLDIGRKNEFKFA